MFVMPIHWWRRTEPSAKPGACVARYTVYAVTSPPKSRTSLARNAHMPRRWAARCWSTETKCDALLPCAQQARFDGVRFRGNAWGENVGWINLDDVEVYVSLGGGCTADCNGDGNLNILDFVCYQNAFQLGCP